MTKIANRILSPTAINTYLRCPRGFYLRYIKRLSTRPNIHLVRGRIVHQTLHDFHRNRAQKLPGMPIGTVRQELLETFRRHWDQAQGEIERLGLPESEIESFKDDSETMLWNFSHWFYRHDMPKAELSEAKFISPSLRLMGYVDAVYEDDNRVILVDYKTSKSTQITEEILRQASLYGLLYEDRYHRRPDVFWVHFLKVLDEPAVIRMDDGLLQDAKDLVRAVHEKTISVSEADYPCQCGGYCERDFAGR